MNTKGEALLTYTRTSGVSRRVLAWGAINAPHADPGVPQVAFKCDYAGGWGKYRNAELLADVPERVPAVRRAGARLRRRRVQGARRELLGACRRGSGVCRCSASRRGCRSQTAYEFHVSHWSGRARDADGRRRTGRTAAARGRAVRPAHLRRQAGPRLRRRRRATRATATAATSTSTRTTRPTAPGWARESGILLHRGSGTFCYSFVPQRPFARLSRPADAPAGAGRALPRHGDGAGRDADRPVGGRGPRALVGDARAARGAGAGAGCSGTR